MCAQGRGGGLSWLHSGCTPHTATPNAGTCCSSLYRAPRAPTLSSQSALDSPGPDPRVHKQTTHSQSRASHPTSSQRLTGSSRTGHTLSRHACTHTRKGPPMPLPPGISQGRADAGYTHTHARTRRRTCRPAGSAAASARPPLPVLRSQEVKWGRVRAQSHLASTQEHGKQ